MVPAIPNQHINYPRESAIFDPLTLDVQKDEMLSKKPRFKIQLLFIQMENQILKEKMLINSNSHYSKLIDQKIHISGVRYSIVNSVEGT